jgi:hypothetical protein
LKKPVFRLSLFFLTILVFFLYYSGQFALPAPGDIDKNPLQQFSLLLLFFLFSFLIGFFSARYTLFTGSNSASIIRSNIFAKQKLPFKFGELIKKDFLYYWKTYDAWISLLSAIFCGIIIFYGSFSFSSFSVGISFILLMCAGLPFNSFGLEKSAGLERLSLFPISNRDLLITKNKSFALLTLSQVSFLFPLILYKFGIFSLVISLLQTASVILLYAAWGNNLSVKYPFKMDFYQFSFGGSLPAMIYGGVIISLLIIGTEFLTASNSIVNLSANVLLIIFCFFIYRYFLQKSAGLIFKNRETIRLKIN